ncbi:MAG: radical SAM protein, partial [Deltaproteobacteria bacterium]|nr:radical SAM protein [Deltaproteobacteria bacterium]
LRWYAYCAPVPFSPELARTMHRAGCVGINFGVDSGDGEILRRLGRDFSPDDIAQTASWCKESGMAVMLDLLLGSPGESRESLVRTLELMKRINPERVGVAVGVRVYPGTELARHLRNEGQDEGLGTGENGSEPLFFLEPRIAPFVFDLLDEQIGADQRFFFFDPSRPERNYNYNANQRLSEAIRKGYRGAYWDILRRYE